MRTDAERQARDERWKYANREGVYLDDYCLGAERMDHAADELPGFLDLLNQKRANRGKEPINNQGE